MEVVNFLDLQFLEIELPDLLDLVQLPLYDAPMIVHSQPLPVDSAAPRKALGSDEGGEEGADGADDKVHVNHSAPLFSRQTTLVSRCVDVVRFPASSLPCRFYPPSSIVTDCKRILKL